MTREESLLLIKQKYAETGLIPKKGDFTPDKVAAIKGFFGPWRYALEEAGILPSKKEERLKKNKQKHIQAKINRRNAKIKKSEVLL